MRLSQLHLSRLPSPPGHCLRKASSTPLVSHLSPVDINEVAVTRHFFSLRPQRISTRTRPLRHFHLSPVENFKRRGRFTFHHPFTDGPEYSVQSHRSRNLQLMNLPQSPHRLFLSPLRGVRNCAKKPTLGRQLEINRYLADMNNVGYVTSPLLSCATPSRKNIQP